MLTPVGAARDRFVQAVDELRAVAEGAPAAELCSVLLACEAAERRLDQVVVSALAAAERQDVFAARGYRSTSGALADLLRWEPVRSRRFVTAAEQVVERVALDGTVLPPALTSTASGFEAGDVSMRHVEVIAAVLGTSVAGRLAPDRWAAAEDALAAYAPAGAPRSTFHTASPRPTSWKAATGSPPACAARSAVCGRSRPPGSTPAGWCCGSGTRTSPRPAPPGGRCAATAPPTCSGPCHSGWTSGAVRSHTR